MADDDLEIGADEEESSNGHGPTVLTSKKSSEEEPYRKGEMRTVEWVDGLFNEAENAKNEQCDPDTWEDSLSTYWGDTWPSQMPSYKPRIEVNEIKSLMLQELSDLTDSRLTVYVQKNKESAERDKNAEQAIQTYWKRNYADMTVLQSALDALIYPLGFLQTGWDPLMRQGQGDILFKSRDPDSVFPDPDAEWDPQSGEESMRYMILEDILDILDIRRRFPETGYLVKPEEAYSVKARQTSEGRPGPRGSSGYMGPLYNKTGYGAGVPGYKKARAQVLTCVVDDPETEQEITEIQGVLRQVERYKYPHRRMLITANGRVLYDEDQPFWYAPILTSVRLQPSVHSYWPAQSLVAEFAEIQRSANKADSMVIENMLRCNSAVIMADADSGISPKTYAPIPGLVILRKPGSRIDVVQATPMAPEMLTEGERLRGYIRGVMGYPTSRTGAGTHGNVAAELAETEISQAMGLTRLRGRLLYQSVQRAVEMIFARMAQFYQTPRHLPYVEQGDLHTIKWEPIMQPEDYAVHVDEDSFSVRSKTMVQRLALMLAKMGKLPDEELLKTLEFPNAVEVAKKLQTQLLLQAIAKMKQGKKK